MVPDCEKVIPPDVLNYGLYEKVLLCKPLQDLLQIEQNTIALVQLHMLLYQTFVKDLEVQVPHEHQQHFAPEQAIKKIQRVKYTGKNIYVSSAQG